MTFRKGTRHDCKSASIIQNRLITFGRKLFPRKTSEIDCLPQAIPTPCEVMTQQRRSETRIDPAEHDTQMRHRNIPQTRRGLCNSKQFQSTPSSNAQTGIERRDVDTSYPIFIRPMCRNDTSFHRVYRPFARAWSLDHNPTTLLTA